MLTLSVRESQLHSTQLCPNKRTLDLLAINTVGFVVGILDQWKDYRAKSRHRSYEKMGDTLKNLVTTKEQRLEAIEALAGADDMGLAVPQLMKRFELVVEHGIIDKREKERVFEVLVEHAKISRPLVCDAVKSSKRISWHIKLAEKLLPDAEYQSLLLSSLNIESVLFDEAVHERNIEILLALKEKLTEKAVDPAKILVRSRDEQVRMAALECLEAQASEFESARQCLRELLAEPLTDDNSRFLGLVKAIVTKHNWGAASPQ